MPRDEGNSWPGWHYHHKHHFAAVPLRSQIARFLWCMIRLDLCHGSSVDRLAGYISESLQPLPVLICLSCIFCVGGRVVRSMFFFSF